MKLYEVPNKTHVRVEGETVVFFDHIDGMYSYCLTKENLVCHVYAAADVDIVDGFD